MRVTASSVHVRSCRMIDISVPSPALSGMAPPSTPIPEPAHEGSSSGDFSSYMQRPSWDEYFMTIAEQVATRSTCCRRQIGAIIVRDRHILSTGYNGAPAGLPHCLQVGCLREQRGIPSGTQHELCRGVHAEQNAVVQAARHGIALDGATIYTTTQPCVTCVKIIINAGITSIVYRDPYPDDLAQELLAESGVSIRRM
jgi:dCMP deaminase